MFDCHSNSTIFSVEFPAALIQFIERKLDIDYEISSLESLCKEDAIDEGYSSYTLEDFIDQYV